MKKDIADLSISPHDRKIVESDVSFVGRLYTEEHNLYDRMEPKLDDYTKGYLEGIMESQRMIYGYTFIEELLTPGIVEKCGCNACKSAGKRDGEYRIYLCKLFFNAAK